MLKPVRLGFLPPYVLDHIVARGSPRLVECARHTLLEDKFFRARNGTLGLYPVSAEGGQPSRYIHSAEHRQTLPGTLVRREGDAGSGDIAVDEAYAWLGATHRFFWEIYNRHSIDDAGMALLGTVHYGQDYENAFWDGSQMVFGDGDGELFNRFTIALDVVGHEMAHGVIEREAALVYSHQAGALNESMADVLGTLVKQYHLRQRADQADWLIGSGLFTERVQGRAMRSMAEPGTAYDDPVLGRDPQPAHMRDYLETEQDNGGVHINSGIPNHAFYLCAKALGGHAWEQSGRIWYTTLRDTRLDPQSDFNHFAMLTLDNARRHYGTGGPQQDAVAEAWRSVGVELS